MNHPVSVRWLGQLLAHPAAALIWTDPPHPQPSRHHTIRAIRVTRIRAGGGSVGYPDRSAGVVIAALLRSRPGRWAIVYTGDARNADLLQQTIHRGGRGFRYAGQYRAVTRIGINTGMTTVYARYRPEGDG